MANMMISMVAAEARRVQAENQQDERNNKHLRTMPSKKKLVQKVERFIARAGARPFHISQLRQEFNVY
ncbi:hypothetical protein ACFIOY_13495 [Bradyrhizobium sp. TZ2]